MRMIAATILLAAIAFPPAALGADDLQCFFESRQICDATGCVEANPKNIHINVWANSKQYGRCDAKSPCDWFPMTISKSGSFLNIDFSTGVHGAKMSQDGSIFIETIGIMDKVIISHGSCKKSDTEMRSKNPKKKFCEYQKDSRNSPGIKCSG